MFLVILTLAFAFSLGPRIRQYTEWTSRAGEFFSNGVVVSSADSYRWFRFAEEMSAGVFAGSDRDMLRAHPTGVTHTEFPALSWLMARLAKARDIDVYRAGMLLMIPLSSLFLFPLGAYFFRLGYPLAGILGGLVGSFSAAYVVRAYVHRVDTDGGNLFFMWLVALCIYAVAAASTRSGRWVAAALTGLTIQLFCLWYGQPGLALVLVGCLLLQLLVARISPRETGLLVALSLVFANPWNAVRGAVDLHAFLHDYVLGLGNSESVVDVQGVAFPSLLAEIGELRRMGLSDSLGSLLDPPVLAALGLGAFAVFAVRNARVIIPLLPMLALGLLGLFRSMRFLMYLAPFVGIGYGYAFTRLLGAARGSAAQRVDAENETWRPRREALVYGVSLLAFAAILGNTAYAREPSTRIRVELIASLQALRERLPIDASVAHSWGHGYLVTAVTRAPTYNDGELLDPVFEQLLDYGLASGDPRALHDVLGFLAVHGREGVERTLAEVSSHGALLERIGAAEAVPSKPVALLLTDKMAREFSHSFRKGRWDFAERQGPREGYDFRRCSGDEVGDLRCERTDRKPLLVDPRRGTINGRRAVAKLVRVRHGEVVEELDFPVRHGLVLQLIESPGSPSLELHILKRLVYETNFNQMFVLGRYDAALFRKLHDDFPVARAYEVIGAVQYEVEGEIAEHEN